MLLEINGLTKYFGGLARALAVKPKLLKAHSKR